MLDVGLDGSSSILRVDVLERPREEASTSAPPPPPPAPYFNDNSMEDEGMVDDRAMNIDMEDHPNIKE